VYDKYAPYIDTPAYIVDPMASKAVQEVTTSIDGMFVNLNRTFDNSSTWSSDPVGIQRQRLALIDEQLRQTESKLVVLGGFARSPGANRADKKLYKQALHDYKKLTGRRNKMWKKL